MTEICDAPNAKDLRSAIIAACAMLLAFAAVAVPVPLYAEYKIALGLTDAGISLTMVSYLTGVLIVLMMLNAILLPLAQETVTQRITIRKAIKPLVRIPKNLRPVFPLAAGCYIAAWGTGVFFQSLSTPAAVTYFQSTDPLIPALMFALAMAPSALGGPMSARTTTRFAVYGGTALLCISYAILWVTLTKGITVPFLIADGVFSVSTGILLSASMHMLISYSDPADSASVVSLINFTGYVGSTAVSIAMSTIANTLALSTVLMVGFVISMVFMIPGFATKALRK
ncbi:hypothetical protein [Senegalimassilia anaerobia]|uniref:hypothetical protein n=1 Tax=Senegalimassilia anaerobia TaxID=1473216 RepID=UPI0025F011A9|nr:hypothetical protein [Senegalimassilia anaerobia]